MNGRRQPSSAATATPNSPSTNIWRATQVAPTAAPTSIRAARTTTTSTSTCRCQTPNHADRSAVAIRSYLIDCIAGCSHENKKLLISGNCTDSKLNNGINTNDPTRIQKSSPSTPGVVLVIRLSSGFENICPYTTPTTAEIPKKIQISIAWKLSRDSNG